MNNRVSFYTKREAGVGTVCGFFLATGGRAEDDDDVSTGCWDLGRGAKEEVRGTINMP